MYGIECLTIFDPTRSVHVDSRYGKAKHAVAFDLKTVVVRCYSCVASVVTVPDLKIRDYTNGRTMVAAWYGCGAYKCVAYLHIALELSGYAYKVEQPVNSLNLIG